MGTNVLLKICQILHRNGDAVYVDYLRQFSGEKAPRAARGTGKTAAAARADGGGAAAGGDAGKRQGHWLTEAGKKVRVPHNDAASNMGFPDVEKPHNVL